MTPPPTPPVLLSVTPLLEVLYSARGPAPKSTRTGRRDSSWKHLSRRRPYWCGPRPGTGDPTARTRARKFARARVNPRPCTCALSHTPARARARTHLEANGLRHGAVGRLVSPPGRPSHVRYRANLRAGRGRGAAGALGIRAPRRNDGRALRTRKITVRSRTITRRSWPVTAGHVAREISGRSRPVTAERSQEDHGRSRGHGRRRSSPSRG